MRTPANLLSNIAVAGAVTRRHAGPSRTDAFDAADMIAAVLNRREFLFDRSADAVRLRESELAMSPRVMAVIALPDGRCQTVCTVTVRHQTLFPDALFEYPHAPGRFVSGALATGFAEWIDTDLDVLVEGITGRVDLPGGGPGPPGRGVDSGRDGRGPVRPELGRAGRGPLAGVWRCPRPTPTAAAGGTARARRRRPSSPRAQSKGSAWAPLRRPPGEVSPPAIVQGRYQQRRPSPGEHPPGREGQEALERRGGRGDGRRLQQVGARRYSVHGSPLVRCPGLATRPGLETFFVSERPITEAT